MTRPFRPVLPLLALLCAAVVLTACGSDSGSGSGGGKSDEEQRLAFLDCLRDQGLEVSDDGRGIGIRMNRGEGGSGGAQLADSRDAFATCREKTGWAPPEADRGAAAGDAGEGLRFARCMREHGADVPDPAPDGRMMMSRARRQRRLRAGAEACGSLMGEKGAPRRPPRTANGEGALLIVAGLPLVAAGALAAVVVRERRGHADRCRGRRRDARGDRGSCERRTLVGQRDRRRHARLRLQPPRARPPRRHAHLAAAHRRGDPPGRADLRGRRRDPVILLNGTTPAWRAMASGDEGADVLQLERNLAALGHDPGTVDDDYTSATATAVRAWQEEWGMTETGRVELGDVVFLPGARRVSKLTGTLGESGGNQPATWNGGQLQTAFAADTTSTETVPAATVPTTPRRSRRRRPRRRRPRRRRSRRRHRRRSRSHRRERSRRRSLPPEPRRRPSPAAAAVGRRAAPETVAEAEAEATSRAAPATEAARATEVAAARTPAPRCWRRQRPSGS